MVDGGKCDLKELMKVAVTSTEPTEPKNEIIFMVGDL